MSKELEIRTALYDAFSGIEYGGSPVPFYDMVRDDVSTPHIYVSGITSNYAGTKSRDLWDVSLMLGIRETFDGAFGGKKGIDEIGESVETIMESPLTLTNFTTVIQYLDRSFYAEQAGKSVKDAIKVYIYKLKLEKNG